MPMIGEGVLIATVLGMLAKEGIAFSLLKRRERNNGNGKNSNGKGNHKSNNIIKAGKSTICTENIRLISGHEVLLTQLCTNVEKNEQAIINLHKESRDDYREINRKLDRLNGGG